MGNTVNESVEEFDKQHANSLKWYANWKFIAIGIIIIIAFIFAAISYYQATHFNANITINGTKVGGLTADQALEKLKTSVLKNVVYVGEQQILDGKDTKMGFTDKELPGVKKILKSQRTFFPSFKEKNYSLMPSKLDQYRSQDDEKTSGRKALIHE